MGLISADFMKVVTHFSLSTDCHQTTFSPVPPKTGFSSAPKQDVFPLISPTKVGFNLGKQRARSFTVQSFISSQTAASGGSILQHSALQRPGGRDEAGRDAEELLQPKE